MFDDDHDAATCDFHDCNRIDPSGRNEDDIRRYIEPNFATGQFKIENYAIAIPAAHDDN